LGGGREKAISLKWETGSHRPSLSKEGERRLFYLRQNTQSEKEDALLGKREGVGRRFRKKRGRLSSRGGKISLKILL